MEPVFFQGCYWIKQLMMSTKFAIFLNDLQALPVDPRHIATPILEPPSLRRLGAFIAQVVLGIQQEVPKALQQLHHGLVWETEQRKKRIVGNRSYLGLEVIATRVEPIAIRLEMVGVYTKLVASTCINHIKYIKHQTCEHWFDILKARVSDSFFGFHRSLIGSISSLPKQWKPCSLSRITPLWPVKLTGLL